MAAQDNSCLWVLVPSGDRPGPTEPAGETLASLVLIGPSAHVRGPVLGLSIRALRRQATLAPVRTTSARPRRSASAVKSRPWQLASLVLINRLAHVRGPVPGLSIRAHGSSLSLVLIKRLAHVRGGLHPGQFAPMAARCRSCSSGRQRTCAAQCLGSQFAPMAARFARAHQETSARPRGLNSRQASL